MFSVLRSGRKAVAADLFADADLAQHCPVTQISPYPEGLVDWLAATECDGWIYTGALENQPDLVDRLAAIRPLFGNQGRVLRRCRDPQTLQAVLGANNLNFPETRASCTGLPRDGSWLCKTYRGSSGNGVWELVDDDSQRKAEATGAYFQKRIEGWPVSVVYSLGEHETTLGMTAQWVGASATGAARFQYAGSLSLPQEIEPALRKQIDRLAHVLSDQFQLRGLVGVDLLIEGSRVWVIEINPRYTASVEVLERSSGVSSIDAHLAACAGEAFEPTRRNEPSQIFHGKAILYAKQDITIKADFFDWAIEQSGTTRDSRLADVPVVGSIIPCGRPVLTVLALTSEAQGDHFLLCRIAEVESRIYGTLGVLETASEP